MMCFSNVNVGCCDGLVNLVKYEGLTGKFIWQRLIRPRKPSVMEDGGSIPKRSDYIIGSQLYITDMWYSREFDFLSVVINTHMGGGFGDPVSTGLAAHLVRVSTSGWQDWDTSDWFSGTNGTAPPSQGKRSQLVNVNGGVFSSGIKTPIVAPPMGQIGELGRKYGPDGTVLSVTDARSLDLYYGNPVVGMSPNNSGGFVVATAGDNLRDGAINDGVTMFDSGMGIIWTIPAPGGTNTCDAAGNVIANGPTDFIGYLRSTDGAHIDVPGLHTDPRQGVARSAVYDGSLFQRYEPSPTPGGGTGSWVVRRGGTPPWPMEWVAATADPRFLNWGKPLALDANAGVLAYARGGTEANEAPPLADFTFMSPERRVFALTTDGDPLWTQIFIKGSAVAHVQVDNAGDVYVAAWTPGEKFPKTDRIEN